MAHYSGVRRSRLLDAQGNRLQFRTAVTINGRGRGNTLIVLCGTKTPFSPPVELPADQFRTIALPAHNQPESPHLRGRRPAPAFQDHWAGSRRPAPYGFNLAHVACEAVGHRPVEAHASRQESVICGDLAAVFPFEFPVFPKKTRDL